MTTQIWGRALWIFFHTFGAKINEDFFTKNRIFILNTTQKLLSCIPCDMCQKHAMAYIRKKPLSVIKSKTDYIHYFTNFHNEVNKLKNINHFTDIHIYQEYNIQKVLIYFKKFYTYYKYNKILFMQNSKRENIGEVMIQFVTNNIQQFT